MDVVHEHVEETEGYESGVFVGNVVAPKVVTKTEEFPELGNEGLFALDLLLQVLRKVLKSCCQEVFNAWIVEDSRACLQLNLWLFGELDYLILDDLWSFLILTSNFLVLVRFFSFLVSFGDVVAHDLILIFKEFKNLHLHFLKPFGFPFLELTLRSFEISCLNNIIHFILFGNDWCWCLTDLTCVQGCWVFIGAGWADPDHQSHIFFSLLLLLFLLLFDLFNDLLFD